MLPPARIGTYNILFNVTRFDKKCVVLPCFVQYLNYILYFIIVREPTISGTIAARGLKFWLQVALLAPIATPWTQIRKSGSGSGKSGFNGIFFCFFRFYGPLCRPQMVWNHLIRIRIWEIQFFENPDFSFFRLFKLKYPTIWVSIDSPWPSTEYYPFELERATGPEGRSCEFC